MSDDDTRMPGEASGPEPQPGAVIAPPPPPPPAPATTGECPPEPRRKGGLVVGLVLVAVGLVLLAQQFFPQIDLGRLWPVIIIVIGLSIIFRRR